MAGNPMCQFSATLPTAKLLLSMSGLEKADRRIGFRQSATAGTGGKTQQMGISKRGDTYLRTLLISGARSIVGRSLPTGWIERLLQRRHFNVVVAAVANKMARTIWAVLAKGKAFDQVKWNPTQATSA
jgi:transposase